VGGDVNLYAYVSNLPIQARDPLGLFRVSIDHGPACDWLGGRKDRCGDEVRDSLVTLEAGAPGATDDDLRGRRDLAWARSVGNGLERGAQRILERAAAGAKPGSPIDVQGRRAENVWHMLRNGRPFETVPDKTGSGFGHRFYREDGTAVNLRWNAEGQLRIEIGNQKFIFQK